MSVVTAMEEAGPCRLKLTLEIPATAVDAETGRVVSEYRKHAAFPGFRKGKVPAGFLRKRFKDEIRQEVVDRLLPRYWRQAEAEKDLDPLLPPTVEELKVEDGEPMVVVAAVETRPEITIGEVRDIELPEESTEPAPDELEDALADLRRSFAEWNLVERPAAQGDLVVGSMVQQSVTEPAASADDAATESADDAAADEPAESPFRFEIGAEGADEELSLALVGKRSGQEVEHRVTLPPAEGEGVGAEMLYTIRIDQVQEQDLPELDDALAARVGDFETVDGLREAVSRSLAERKKVELRQRRETALLEALRERHPVTLPQGVVDHEVQTTLRRYAENMAQQGVDLDDGRVDWDAMVDSVRPQAEKRVHERLVLDAIAKHEEATVDEAKFERILGAVATQQRTTSHALRQQLAEEGRLEDLRASVLRDQVVADLLGEESSSEDTEALAATSEAGAPASSPDPYADALDDGDDATTSKSDPYAELFDEDDD
ncbi:MAG: trigger factor [Acidobacteriota bacterium]